MKRWKRKRSSATNGPRTVRVSLLYIVVGKKLEKNDLEDTVGTMMTHEDHLRGPKFRKKTLAGVRKIR
ncbi:hypothetical protein L3Y34_016434 [Caenorhabditis briggsae]|nr:hypothetical protein L3Y34_016434 [Caenorhabditis briggsae]